MIYTIFYNLGEILVSSVVSFIIGIALSSLFHFIIQKRAQTRALAFWTGKTKKVTVIYGTRRPKPILLDKDFSPANVDVFEIVNTNDVRAIVEASSYLRNISDFSIKSHDMPYTKKDNLFLIGGPIANKSTEEVIDRLKTKPTFSFNLSPDHREIRNDNNTAVYKTVFEVDQVTKQKKIVKDCGWFMRDKNPFDSDYVVVIAAGLFGYGTEAVAQCLTSNKHLRRINNALKESNNYRIEGIVEAGIDSDEVTVLSLHLYPIV